jgi:alkylation response protein AidB-like acyl-CoA dehydrogenase
VNEAVTYSSRPSESGELGELRAHLRRLLERHWTAQQRLAFAGGDRTQGVNVADVLEGAIGINGLLASENLGGSGAGCREVVAVAEELGAALTPSNILGSSMAAYVLQQAEGHEVNRVLEDSIRQRARSVFVWPGSDALWLNPPPASAGDGRISGDFTQVGDADITTALVVPAAGDGTDGVAWLRGGSGDPGVRITARQTPDVFRELSDVRMRDATAEFFSVKNAEHVWAATLALGSLVLAAEMVGAGMECLQLVVDYGKARVQFGRPVATFQAVKHRTVDALIELEAARALTFQAADRFPLPTDPLPGRELIDLARMAKAAAGDALRRAALECVQLHGAIGFTWDHPAHLYLKRWATSSCLFGQAEDLRRLVYQSAVGRQLSSERGSSAIH